MEIMFPDIFFKELESFHLVHIGLHIPYEFAQLTRHVEKKYSSLKEYLADIQCRKNTKKTLFFATNRAFSCAKAEDRLLFLHECSLFQSSFLVLDYTIAERTLEWFFGWIKYVHLLKEGASFSAVQDFFRTGGMDGLLYRFHASYTQIARDNITQCVLYKGSFF